ncbi:MAG TPA: rhodanese-like domain-containing protein [Saprospiraceae bacterium]|nr:rhodanese-like domain-containing protein [Saprospiraceae bacterium]HND86961.1 rhodanese-like domain-containing protein [Saprospiraceae bacterium]
MRTFCLLSALLLFCCAACSHQASFDNASPEEFEAACKAVPPAQLIDVRTPQEYQGGHIDKAANIDFYAPDFAEQLRRLKPDQQVLVYCAVGGRSSQAAAQLSRLGFGRVTNLQGGMQAWRAAGKPVAH